MIMAHICNLCFKFIHSIVTYNKLFCTTLLFLYRVIVVCIYSLCMGFGVHTTLINLHPVSGSVEDGFELCRMYGS